MKTFFASFLTDDATRWRTMWSLWGGLVIAALSLLQATVLPLWQFAIPPAVFPWVSGALATLVLLLRKIEGSGKPYKRLASVWASGGLAALSGVQTQILPLLASAIPAGVYPWLTAVLGTAIAIARLVAQPDVGGEDHAHEDNV